MTEVGYAERSDQEGVRASALLPNLQRLTEAQPSTAIVVAESLSKRFGTVLAVASLRPYARHSNG